MIKCLLCCYFMEKCSAVTTKGKQCRKSVALGTKYCNVHNNQNKQSLLSKDSWLSFYKKRWVQLLGLISFIALIIGLTVDVNSLLDRKKNATSGVITSSKNTSERNVLIGSTRFLVNNNDGGLVYDNE